MYKKPHCKELEQKIHQLEKEILELKYFEKPSVDIDIQLTEFSDVTFEAIFLS